MRGRSVHGPEPLPGEKIHEIFRISAAAWKSEGIWIPPSFLSKSQRLPTAEGAGLGYHLHSLRSQFLSCYFDDFRSGSVHLGILDRESISQRLLQRSLGGLPGRAPGERSLGGLPGSAPQTGASNRRLKQGPQTGTSNRDLKQGPRTGTSNRDLEQGPQTGTGIAP